MQDKNQPTISLQSPFYFPLEDGQYEVKPGLYKFPHDFGNDRFDQQIFQFDGEYNRYRAIKLAARSERLHKYYCQQNFDSSASRLINQFILQRLAHEHPNRFHVEPVNRKYILYCRSNQDILTFDHQYRLVKTSQQQTIYPPYADAFDALACQLQEDISVIQVSETGDDQIIALHLCFPNHWAAEDKIGQNFIHTHQAVPAMEKIKLSAKQLVHAMLNKGPFVRFAWGIATDIQLNKHPANTDKNQMKSRSFNVQHPELYLRVERQTIHGFEAQKLALFTIRTYFYNIQQIGEHLPGHIPLLINAIESMDKSSLNYKGIYSDSPAILNWLKGLANR